MPDVILKYRLDLCSPTPIRLPRDHRVVLVTQQGGEPFVWIRQPQAPAGSPATCTFTVVGTGQTFDAAALHVGSYTFGGFVWHVLQT